MARMNVHTYTSVQKRKINALGWHEYPTLPQKKIHEGNDEIMLYARFIQIKRK